jgi:hypothetical protein
VRSIWISSRVGPCRAQCQGRQLSDRRVRLRRAWMLLQLALCGDRRALHSQTHRRACARPTEIRKTGGRTTEASAAAGSTAGRIMHATPRAHKHHEPPDVSALSREDNCWQLEL